jgi:hypothetical protein
MTAWRLAHRFCALLRLLLCVRVCLPISYNADVQVRLEELGFTQFWNKPLLTNQTGCTYPPPSKIEDAEAEKKAPRIRLSEV